MMEAAAGPLAWLSLVVWPAVSALAILLAGWLAASLVERPLRRWADRESQRREVIGLAVVVLRWVVVGAAVLTALGTVGVDITALVAGVGLTGLTIGFALKDVASSLMAGMMLMLYRPFRRGDRIAVVGLEGVVAGMDLRYTHLEAEGKRYLVPNATVLTNAVTVFAVPPKDSAPAP